MTKTNPELVIALSNSDAYQDKPKKIKFWETSSSYIFQADKFIYKIKKTGNEYSTLAIKEAFCNEECKLSKRFNPDLNLQVIQIMENNGKIKIGGKEGSPIEYTLKMEAFPERSSLLKLLETEKVSEGQISKIANSLIHNNSFIFLEIGKSQTANVEKIFINQNIKLIKISKDYQRINRVLVLKK